MKQSAIEKSTERKLGRPHGSSSEDRRARLLKAAGEQFNVRAFSEVSMAEIARSAGITGAAIYNYFDSKDELFQETVKDRIINYNRFISDAVAISGSWKDKLNNLLDAVAELQEQNAAFPQIAAVVQARLLREPEKYQEIRDLRNESSLIYGSLISEAIHDGDLPKDIDISITGDLLMAITAGAIPTVSFYHSEPGDTDQIIGAVRALLGIDR